MNILKKIILFKIILFEKQKRAFEESEVYGAVWIVLLQFVAYTLALGGFIITGIYPSLKSYNVVIGITMFIISSGFIRLYIIKPIKQKRAFEESEVYTAIWATLWLCFLYTVGIIGFFTARLYPSLKSYNAAIGIIIAILTSGFIRLCIIRPIKQNKLVPSIYAEYQNMNQEEKKRYYRKGLIVVASFILYPFLLLAIMSIV